MSLGTPAGMIIERDLPIEINDGIELRAGIAAQTKGELSLTKRSRLFELL